MGRQQFDHDALHPISNWFLSCRNLPVGMKIADYFNKGLGKSLGFSGRLSIRHCFSAFTKNNGAFPWKSYTHHFFPCPLGGLMIVS
jgi:hypothetical protein